jgi:flagellar biosynthesis protein FlhB
MRNLSEHIAELKLKKNEVQDESEKERLTEEIKMRMRQFQVSLYLEKWVRFSP